MAAQGPPGNTVPASPKRFPPWAALLLLLAASPAPGREYIICMTLPATGQAPDTACYDTIPGPPIRELQWLRIKGWCFNPARGDTFHSSVGVEGMEGDSVCVGIEIPDTLAMGVLEFKLVNPIDESCPAWWVFAGPKRGD